MLSRKALRLLYFAHVHSHLNYSSIVLSCCTKAALNPLLVIQKKAIRIINKKNYRHPSAALFADSEILPLKNLIDFNLLRFIYDYKNDKLPSSFADNWERNNQREGYNLRNGNEFYLPRIRFNYLENHPLFAMPRIWNNLKVDFKFTMSRKTFKFSLKQYMYSAHIRKRFYS